MQYFRVVGTTADCKLGWTILAFVSFAWLALLQFGDLNVCTFSAAALPAKIPFMLGQKQPVSLNFAVTRHVMLHQQSSRVISRAEEEGT